MLGVVPRSAAPTHLRISARDERKHTCTDPQRQTQIRRQTQTDTKTRRQTHRGRGGGLQTGGGRRGEDYPKPREEARQHRTHD